MDKISVLFKVNRLSASQRRIRNRARLFDGQKQTLMSGACNPPYLHLLHNNKVTPALIKAGVMD